MTRKKKKIQENTAGGGGLSSGIGNSFFIIKSNLANDIEKKTK